MQAHAPESAFTRTTNPLVTGGSVVALKYAGGEREVAREQCA